MEEKIKGLIGKYIDFLKQNPGNDEEVYKWEAIMHFHKHWNPDAENFWTMFKEAFKKHYNLVHFISYSFFEKLGKYDDDLLRQYILDLYDESVDLKTRFFRHKEFADKYMAKINQKTGRNDKHTQDDRTISFLLTFRFPEKYYLYKPSVHKQLCEYLDVKKVSGFYKQYVHFAGIGDEFLPFINNNVELQSLAKGFIPEDFQFDSTRLLFQDMVYQMLMPEKDEQANEISEILNNPGNRKFWLFSPGENASKWDEFYEKGIMGLGWDAIGDLKQYDSVEAIREALQQADNEPDNKKYNDVLANEEFLNVMQPGDIVIAKKGLSKLIGYGEVVSGYKYDKSRTSYQKIREVNWFKKGEWQAPNSLPMKTLTEITAESARKYIGVMEGKISPETVNNTLESNFPINQILYGPPGTGKTYKTKQIAVEIIDGKAPADRMELNKRYDELVNDGQIAFVSFHQSMNYEDFIEGIKPALNEKDEVIYKIEDGIFMKIAKDARENRNQNYVLIIDEINRANVSAVFGELISLIEPDKRSGQKESLEAVLPYSKEKFSVPDNLYLIGTMNTADRSVEALDTALRRRFSFFELMPDAGIFEKLGETNEIFPGIRKSDILTTINNRIEVLLDRDHTIGHSYFIGLNTPEELAQAFRDKILPLLQEYFYGDYAKIGMVLGKSFVEKIATNRVGFADFNHTNPTDYRENLYRLKTLEAENMHEAMKNLLNKQDEN